MELVDVTKRYGDVVAVENVSMEVPEGEFLTFLGPSGSGKSTTLYAIAGFEQPSSGDILLKGKSILNTIEMEMIRRAMEETRGNQLRSAIILGINRSTLKKRLLEMREAGIKVFT